MSYWAVGLLVEVTEVAHMLEYFGKWRMQRSVYVGVCAYFHMLVAEQHGIIHILETFCYLFVFELAAGCTCNKVSEALLYYLTQYF